MADYIYIPVLILTLIISILIYFKWKFLYWSNKNVPYLEPQIPFGTAENPFRRTRNNAIMFQKQYHYFKALEYKYGGLYLSIRPTFLPVGVELIKNVMSKDFQYFTDRGVYYNEKDDPLSAHLFSLEGQKWRNLRAKLTPTFTSGKIKTMFPTLVACGNPLYTAIRDFYEKEKPVEIKDLLTRFTTDVIGSCAFGLECNSFTEPEGDFRKYGKLIFSAPSRFRALIFLIITANPELARFLRIKISTYRLTKFFLNVVKETVKHRKQNNIMRNDFLQLLMNLMDEDGITEGLTIEQVAAQAFVFFIAGFETSSTTMTFCLYELAINQDIQKKVREEIQSVLTKYDGNISYDAIMEMKYLSNVVDETLRKYPALPSLPRVCVQNYKIPETDTIIEKGTRIIVPVYALHNDPEYFPNPEKFDPDRFNDDNKDDIRPFTYMPFGEGPRICIGLRFGLLQTKVGLAILLRNFNFLLNAKTKFPMEFSKTSFFLSADGGVWLDIEKV